MRDNLQNIFYISDNTSLYRKNTKNSWRRPSCRFCYDSSCTKQALENTDASYNGVRKSGTISSIFCNIIFFIYFSTYIDALRLSEKGRSKIERKMQKKEKKLERIRERIKQGNKWNRRNEIEEELK